MGNPGSPGGAAVDAASLPFCSRGVGLFAGAMSYSKLPFVFRLLMKAIKVPESDFRAWDGIRDWAASVRPLLLGA